MLNKDSFSKNMHKYARSMQEVCKKYALVSLKRQPLEWMGSPFKNTSRVALSRSCSVAGRLLGQPLFSCPPPIHMQLYLDTQNFVTEKCYTLLSQYYMFYTSYRFQYHILQNFLMLDITSSKLHISDSSLTAAGFGREQARVLTALVHTTRLYVTRGQLRE